MLRIVNVVQDFLRLLLLATLISGLLRPVFHYSPICSENRMLAGLVRKCQPKISYVQQLWEVVCVILCRVFGREVVLLRLSGDASLQSTLDGVPSDVVRAGE